MTPKTNRKLTLGFAALLCGVLVPSALGAGGDLQTFQLKLHQGVNTLTPVDPVNKPGLFNMFDVGEATLLGRYVNTGLVQMVPIQASPGFAILFGAGTLTAANGDSMEWQFQPTPEHPERIVMLPGTGTGRFLGATGYIDNFPVSVTPNPDGTVTIVHWAKGELTVPKKTPFKISGQLCFFPFSDVGVATHFGRFVSVDEGSGGATGKYFTANGDQVNWEAGDMTSWDPVTHIFTGINYLRGGTGRFEGATGEYNYTAIPVPGAFLTFDYEGEGFITY